MLDKTNMGNFIGLLDERLRVIGDAELRGRDPEAQLAKLKEVSEAIMAFHVAHRSEIPPRLNHFLENCSFEKAREWANEALVKR